MRSLWCRCRAPRSGCRAAGSLSDAPWPDHRFCRSRFLSPFLRAAAPRPLLSCILRRWASLLGCRRLFRHLWVDPQDEPVREAHIDDLHGAFQDSGRPLQSSELGPRARCPIAREENIDRIVDAQIPTAIAELDPGPDPRRKIPLDCQHIDQIRGVARGTLADDHRQLGKTVEMRHWNDRALVVDQIELAAMLPKRERLAFDETDVERIGQAALDHSPADPGPA